MSTATALRQKDLVGVKEVDGSRVYFITDAGCEAIDRKPRSAEEEAEAAAEERQGQQAEQGHFSGLKQVEPLEQEPHKLSEDRQEDLILEAVDDKYRTLIGIKKRVGFPAWYEIEGLLAGMCMSYKLRKETKGDIVAFFRYEQKPLNFWRIGDGRIDAEFDESFVPRDEAAKAEEMSRWSVKPEAAVSSQRSAVGREEAEDVDDFDPDDDELGEPIGKPAGAFESKVARNGNSIESGKTATPAGKRTGRGAYRYKEITEAAMETATAGSKNVVDLCKKLGISSSALYKKLDENDELKAAFKRGMAMREKPDTSPGKKNGRPMKGEAATEKPRKINYPKTRKPPTPKNGADPASPAFDPAEVERLAAEGMTAKACADYFGVSESQFKNRLVGKTKADKLIRAAWYRGKKAMSSKPAKRTNKKRDKTPDTQTLTETVTPPDAVNTADKSQDKTPAIEATYETKTANGYVEFKVSVPVLDIAQDLSFNLGSAIVSICASDIDTAIGYLQREKARRERQAMEVAGV